MFSGQGNSDQEEKNRARRSEAFPPPSLNYNELTDVKGLEKLDQLTELNLLIDPGLTKAQIEELQKALSKCRIYSNPTK